MSERRTAMGRASPRVSRSEGIVPALLEGIGCLAILVVMAVAILDLLYDLSRGALAFGLRAYDTATAKEIAAVGVVVLAGMLLISGWRAQIARMIRRAFALAVAVALPFLLLSPLIALIAIVYLLGGWALF